MLLDHSSMEKIHPGYTSSLPASPTQKSQSTDILIFFLYLMVVILLFSSVYYSRQVISLIKIKQKNILQLKKSHENILLENNKIEVLLSELKQDHIQHEKLIKIVDGAYFRNKAQAIHQAYKASRKELEDVSFFYILTTGMITIGILRLLYLEFLQRRNKKRTKFRPIQAKALSGNIHSF